MKLIILLLLFAQNLAFAQLFISPHQIRQDGNDVVINNELRIILTGDSVILARSNERNSYPLRSVRKTKKGVVVKFGQVSVKNGQDNKLILFYHKEQAAFLVVANAHYYCWL